MALPVHIRDAYSDSSTIVTSRGQLVTAPLEFSTSYQASTDTTDITNVVKGKAAKIFIVTDIVIAQDKTNTDVDVTLFEADDSSGAATKIFFELGTTRSDRMVATGLNLATSETKWINFQHDSTTANISVTIAGYYIDA